MSIVTKKSADLVSTRAVDMIVEASEEMELAKQTIDAAREVLDAQADELRLNSSYAGILVSAVTARGTNRSINYQFKNSYSSTSTSQESKIRADVGDDAFDNLFCRQTKTQLKPDALEQVRALLGEANFANLFEQTTVLVPVSNFREVAHHYRQTVDRATAAKIDTYEAAFSHRPTLKI